MAKIFAVPCLLERRKRSHPGLRQRPRRGLTYVVVLSTALIVSAIMLAAITLIRVDRRAASGQAGNLQARANALAGLNLVASWIEQDPQWRSRLANGDWSDPVSTTKGTFQLTATDPVDGDLADDPGDPVVIASVGRYGDRSLTLRVMGASSQIPLSVLQTAACARDDLRIEDALVEGTLPLCSNKKVIAAGGSIVLCDVEAGNTVEGSTYLRGKLESQPARTFPDPAAVMDYYLTEATPISINGLPKETPNLIYNPGIEQSSDGWVDSFEAGLDCTLDRDTSEAFSGTASLSVSDRSSAEDGPCFYLTSVAKSGRKVRCRAMVKTEGPSVRFRWMLHTRARSGNESWTNGPWVRVDGNWTEVNATMTYDTWSGPLERAMVKIESHKDDVLEAFRLDDAQCVEFGGEHRLTHLVLSDRSNPFGAVNATGTYVIDCGGKNLLVEHCRIRGTLVIVDPGAGSRIGTGPVSIEPTSPGKASLVVEGNIRIECSGAGLNETYHQVNFNPPGTLYLPLGEDSDQIDTLPSQLSGIIYATGDLVVAGQSRVVDGVLLANGKLTVREHAMIIGTGTLRLNPPPPFRSDWTIRWLERSFRLP